MRGRGGEGGGEAVSSLTRRAISISSGEEGSSGGECEVGEMERHCFRCPEGVDVGVLPLELWVVCRKGWVFNVALLIHYVYIVYSCESTVTNG